MHLCRNKNGFRQRKLYEERKSYSRYSDSIGRGQSPFHEITNALA